MEKLKSNPILKTIIVLLSFLIVGCKGVIYMSNPDIQKSIYTQKWFVKDNKSEVYSQGVIRGQVELEIFFMESSFNRRSKRFKGIIKVSSRDTGEKLSYISFRKGYLNGDVIKDRGEVAFSNENGLMTVDFIIDDSCNVVLFTDPGFITMVYEVNENGFCGN